jgi:hypothetical protein
MRFSLLRSERGQTAGEYMGILLLVAVIIGAFIQFDVDGKIAKATGDMVDLIAGGGKNDNGGGGGSGPGSNPGGGNNPGGSNNPGGGNNPGGSGNPDGSSEDEQHRILVCLNSTHDAGLCLLAARAPNTVSEKINERARDKVRLTQRNLMNSSARPGTPEYNRLVEERAKAIRDLVNSRRITDNLIVKPLAQVRKAVDPRLQDIQKGFDRASEKLRGPKTTAPVPLKPNLASGGPVKPSAASKFLKGLGKVGKGLGIAGTALSLYDNVKNDGVAKGLTKTAGGVAGAWGAGALVTAGCTAVGVATAGVGGLVCAGVAFGAAYLGGKYGSQIAGWGYDRAKDIGNFTNEHVFKPVGHATEVAVDKVKDVGEGAIEGGKKVIGALNPFG